MVVAVATDNRSWPISREGELRAREQDGSRSSGPRRPRRLGHSFHKSRGSTAEPGWEHSASFAGAHQVQTGNTDGESALGDAPPRVPRVWPHPVPDPAEGSVRVPAAVRARARLSRGRAAGGGGARQGVLGILLGSYQVWPLLVLHHVEKAGNN